MTDPQKEHLPVQIVHPADWAFGDMGWERERVGDDPGRLRSGRRESVEVIASHYTRQSPERVRNNSQVSGPTSPERIKGYIFIPRPRRHDQRAVGAEDVAERVDQSQRTSLDRPCGPKGRVYEQDTVLLDSERAQLICYLGYAQLSPFYLAPPTRAPRFLRASAAR